MHVLRNFRVFQALYQPQFVGTARIVILRGVCETVFRPSFRRASGLLLWARSLGMREIDRLLHGPGRAGGPRQPRAVHARCQLTEEDGARFSKLLNKILGK